MAFAGQTAAECRDLASTMKAINDEVRLEAQLRKPLIQKVPHPLRSNEDVAEYFDPQAVAIGPYHRDNPQLQPMESIKKAAAHDLCNSTRHSVDEFYTKVREVVSVARSCYADRFDSMGDEEFADVMFFDGCFLLELVAFDTDDLPYPSVCAGIGAFRMRMIWKDIMLLENQLPWVVLDALMSLRPVRIHQFVLGIVVPLDTELTPRFYEGDGSGRKPCHLLDLVRERYLGPYIAQAGIRLSRLSFFGSAMDLAESGVRLRASKTPRLRDISFRRDLLFGRLSLPPIEIDDGVQSALIANMVAFETCAGNLTDYGVSSCLFLLVHLTNGEEDVKELRLKRIICSKRSDQQILKFFQSLSTHLLIGNNYMYVFQCLDDYYTKRRVRVLAHRFIYHNFKFLLAATSVILFLVTILQTIFTVYPRK